MILITFDPTSFIINDEEKDIEYFDEEEFNTCKNFSINVKMDESRNYVEYLSDPMRTVPNIDLVPEPGFIINTYSKRK